MTAIVHRLDAYGAWLYLARSRRDVTALRRKLNLDPLMSANYGASTICGCDKAGNAEPHLVIFIDVSKHETTPALVDTIGHEVMHTALSLFEHIGETLTADCEPLAYLAGFMAAWTFDHCMEGMAA